MYQIGQQYKQIYFTFSKITLQQTILQYEEGSTNMTV